MEQEGLNEVLKDLQDKPDMSGTQICRECGEELPPEAFGITKKGTRFKTCKRCVNFKRMQTCDRKKRLYKNVDCEEIYHSPEFDGMQMGDVVRLVGRAVRWLESRGCVIRIHGEYKEVKVRSLKFR